MIGLASVPPIELASCEIAAAASGPRQFFCHRKMTLVTFLEPGSGDSRRGSFMVLAGSPQTVEEAQMGGGFGQQTGWIQVGDLSLAFVFPVRVAKTEEPESEQVAA